MVLPLKHKVERSLLCIINILQGTELSYLKLQAFLQGKSVLKYPDRCFLSPLPFQNYKASLGTKYNEKYECFKPSLEAEGALRVNQAFNHEHLCKLWQSLGNRPSWPHAGHSLHREECCGLLHTPALVAVSCVWQLGGYLPTFLGRRKFPP